MLPFISVITIAFALCFIASCSFRICDSILRRSISPKNCLISLPIIFENNISKDKSFRFILKNLSANSKEIKPIKSSLLYKAKLNTLLIFRIRKNGNIFLGALRRLKTIADFRVKVFRISEKLLISRLFERSIILLSLLIAHSNWQVNLFLSKM